MIRRVADSAGDMDSAASSLRDSATETRDRSDTVRERSSELSQDFGRFSEEMLRILRNSTAGNRRSHRRYGAEAQANLKVGSRETSMTMTDVSVGGARLRGDMDGVGAGDLGRLRVPETDTETEVEIVSISDDDVRLQVVGAVDLGGVVAKVADRRG